MIVVVVGAMLAPLPATAQGGSAGLKRVIDSLAKDAVDTQRMSSVSFAVVRGADTIGLGAYGLSWRDPAIPATVSTVYRTGSITKQFSAAAVLQLVDARRLSLDDTVGRFFPSLPPEWKRVHVRELLNHTSGIPSYTNLGPTWSSRMSEDLSPDTLIAMTIGRPLDFASGTSWRYNNTGYALVGRILEVVEGKPYARIIEERLAKPLGLSSLRYCPTLPRPPQDAEGYDRAAGKRFATAARMSLLQPFAAGALCIAAVDLVKWNTALHGGKVLSDSSYRRMTIPEGAAVPRGYGYGIVRDSSPLGIRLAHGGQINGFMTSNSYSPESRLSVVVLANTNTGEVDRLAAQMLRAAEGLPLEPRVQAITLPLAALERHVGQYELTLPGRTMPVAIRIVNGQLTALFGSQAPAALVPFGDHQFMVEDDEQIQLEFTTDAAGAVVGFVLSQGARYEARRVAR